MMKALVIKTMQAYDVSQLTQVVLVGLHATLAIFNIDICYRPPPPILHAQNVTEASLLELSGGTVKKLSNVYKMLLNTYKNVHNPYKLS